MSAFLKLHVPGSPLLMPNPWHAGSARLMQAQGARALATTSYGFAATLGRADGEVDAEPMFAYCADIVSAVDLPVSADLENGYAGTLDEVAASYRRAAAIGLAGASIEDWSGTALYPIEQAAERVAAARAAAPTLVLTGRAEGYVHGMPDLVDTVARLEAYAQAGADVLYAPMIDDLEALRTIVREVPRPVNALLRPGLSIAALADVGVARISVGASLAWVAWRAAAAASRAFLAGDVSWQADTAEGRQAADQAATGGHTI